MWPAKRQHGQKSPFSNEWRAGRTSLSYLMLDGRRKKKKIGETSAETPSASRFTLGRRRYAEQWPFGCGMGL